MIFIDKKFPIQYRVKCDVCGAIKHFNKRYFDKYGWKNHNCKIPEITVFDDVKLPLDMVAVHVKDMDGNIVETLVEAEEFAPICVAPISPGEIERMIQEANADLGEKINEMIHDESRVDTEKIVAKKTKKSK